MNTELQLTRAEAAQVLGIHVRTVGDHVQSGRFSVTKDKKLDLCETVQAYIEMIRGDSDPEAEALDEDQKKEFAKEKLRKLKLEADKLEFDKNEREKVWAPAHEFEEAFAQRLIGIREAMETALDDLKMQIPNISASKSAELDNMLADAFNSIIE